MTESDTTKLFFITKWDEQLKGKSSVQSPHAPRPLLQVSCAAAAACHLTVTCPAPRLSRPATPQLAAPWTATLTTPAWPTWEARPRSSTAPLPTRLTPVSAHVSNHTLHLRWCFLTLSATLFWENMNGNCAEVTYHGVVLAALWKKKQICLHCQKTHERFKWTEVNCHGAAAECSLSVFQCNYRCSTCKHACRRTERLHTRLWTQSGSLRSAAWRFPHGALCRRVFKNNHQLAAPLRPPSISPAPSLPSRPFIWQPHLFPLCWLIALAFLFSRKQEGERKRERERKVLWDFACRY